MEVQALSHKDMYENKKHKGRPIDKKIIQLLNDSNYLKEKRKEYERNGGIVTIIESKDVWKDNGNVGIMKTRSIFIGN